MTARTGDKSKPSLGFLTVVEVAKHGLFGGYLVLTQEGRPLEFHCTAPIRPNRAQEILYGPTLEPYLYGEQIGQTLVGKSKSAPALVCTDQQPVLAMRAHVEMPVALVLPTDESAAASSNDSAREETGSGTTWRLDSAHGSSDLLTFHLGQNDLVVGSQYENDRRQITDQLDQLPGTFDLSEPFDRIREAIAEARQGGK